MAETPALDRIAGLVLAGGLARRMGGGDKGLLRLAGTPLLARVLELMRPQVGAIVLNANGDAGRFAAFGLDVVSDPIAGFAGPLAGILAGLDWAASRGGFSHVASVPTDTPLLPRDLVARLARAVGEGADIACAASGGRSHPPIALWPVHLREPLRRALVEEGMRKIDRWTARYRVAEVAWPDRPVDPFFNINEPEDLAVAESVLAATP
ncbi:MAG: molybdenum cofactor guanylyltransferase MobA [Alphaproteobacteria bacterium]|nr:molybdenum cofactor guanylyltransferase MobA [Alphaproteobacteria bacterium]